MIIIVCGVSGAGKTTIGQLLSEALKVPFFDADELHPCSNLRKMRSGIPLSDDDRQPWLEILAGKLSAWSEENGAILACSALKEVYRIELSRKCTTPITWIVLHGSQSLIGERLKSRKGHFFDAGLLGSQFEDFEAPDYGWLYDASAAPEAILSDILQRLGI
ncbi:MAG: gluconokinase [Gammaproteobacteria bacterium]|nr:gluconokinase [Gammaproteobacteria bacterium]MYF00420.1 gluconokinase [Gammaproteobacteria bacterium]MYG96122.1 gluconokinase [Gammaproteobacteria bacterium]